MILEAMDLLRVEAALLRAQLPELVLRPGPTGQHSQSDPRLPTERPVLHGLQQIHQTGDDIGGQQMRVMDNQVGP